MSSLVPIMWVNTLHIETIDVFTYWKFTYRLELECIFLFSNLSNKLLRSSNKSSMTYELNVILSESGTSHVLFLR